MFYGNSAEPTHLPIYCGRFRTSAAQMSSCDRDLSNLALSRKIVPTPVEEPWTGAWGLIQAALGFGPGLL